MPKKKRQPASVLLFQTKGEVWEIGRRALDVHIAEFAKQGERPDLVLVVQVGDPPRIVLGTVLPASAPPAALGDVLQQAMQEPMSGPPRQPQLIRVGTPAEADALRAVLEPAAMTVEVVAQFASLDALLSEATQMFGAGIVNDYRTSATQAGERLSKDGLRALYREARKFYQEELWDAFDDSEIFTIELPPDAGVSRTLYGIIMGSMGQEFGLALYTSLDDIRRVYELNADDFDRVLEDADADEEALQKSAEMATQFLSLTSIGLTFTPQEEMLPPLVQEAQQLKLPLAHTSAYPLVMRTGGGRMEIATASDLRDMLTAIRAILAWDKQIGALDIEDDLNVSVTSKLSAMADFVPTLTVQTTLIGNPFAPPDDMDDIDDGIFLGDIQPLFDALLGPAANSDSPSPQAAPRTKAAKKPKSIQAKTPAKSSQVYTLKVSLADGPISPAYAEQEISREIHLLGHHTLHDLHQAVFNAFERWEEHLYEFNLGIGPQDRSALYFYQGDWDDVDEGEAGDPQATTLDALGLEVGRHFGYVFDMGDSWEHVVEVVAVKTGTGKGKYPRIGKRVGAAPPQYPDDDEELEDEED